MREFIIKPGGLLEYAGIFLAQAYYNTFSASFILSALLFCNALVFYNIGKKLFSGKAVSLPFILIPVCLLFLLQSNINWLIHFNLGILLTLIFFLLAIGKFRRKIKILPLIFLPVFFYLAGAYAWVFLIMYSLFYIIYDKWVYPVFLLIISILSFLISREFIFILPDSDLLFYCLPLPIIFKSPYFFYFASFIIVTYPVTAKKLFNIELMNNKNFTGYLTFFLCGLTLTILFAKYYNSNAAYAAKLENFLYEQDWDSIIKQQEKYKSSSLVSQYYYNIALAEKGLLCERMFNGPQDYGHRALIIAEWDIEAGIHNIYRGVYFFYTIGLINEAQRWAYESLVSLGYRPENIKMLIKTSLINGFYNVAGKYINLLKKTLHYKDWVKKYEQMLINPGLIMEDPELADKIRIQPKKDFMIRVRNPQSNLLLMLEANPENEKTFEYMMAWFLLEKDIDAVIQNIHTFNDLSYTRLPRHIQEAVFYYGPLPDLGELSISKEVRNLYINYESLAFSSQNNRSPGDERIKQAFSNTYWYYYDFK